LIASSGICDRAMIERAVRAETPRGFVDLNMDALRAGYSIGEGVGSDSIAEVSGV